MHVQYVGTLGSSVSDDHPTCFFTIYDFFFLMDCTKAKKLYQCSSSISLSYDLYGIPMLLKCYRKGLYLWHFFYNVLEVVSGHVMYFIDYKKDIRRVYYLL